MTCIARKVADLIRMGFSDYVLLSESNWKKILLLLIGIIKDTDEKNIRVNTNKLYDYIGVLLCFDNETRQNINKLLKNTPASKSVKDIIGVGIPLHKELLKDDLSAKAVKEYAIKHFTQCMTSKTQFSFYVIYYKKFQRTPQEEMAKYDYRPEDSNGNWAKADVRLSVLGVYTEEVDKRKTVEWFPRYRDIMRFLPNLHNKVTYKHGLVCFYELSENNRVITYLMNRQSQKAYILSFEPFSILKTYDVNIRNIDKSKFYALLNNIKSIDFSVSDKKALKVDIRLFDVSQSCYLYLTNVDSSNTQLILPLKVSHITLEIKVKSTSLDIPLSPLFDLQLLGVPLHFVVEEPRQEYITIEKSDLQNLQNNSDICDAMKAVYKIVFECLKCLLKNQTPPVKCTISGAEQILDKLSKFFK